jgi:large repetitive protein
LYIVDINGCKSSTSAPINISLYPLPAMPSITAVGLASVCQGNTVTLQSSFAGKNIWSNAVEGNSINVGVANNYTVRAVDANGCKSNASLPFYVDIKALPNKPTITADGATTFCLGNKVTLSSNYAAGIKWNTNETIQSLVVSASGKFSLIYTDPNTGCTSLPADTVKVIVNALPIAPIITAGGATSFCLGQDVSLSSSQAPAYFWNTGARTQTIKISSASTYSLYIVDANGCKSPASLPTTITVYPLPNAPVIVAESETTFCPDKSVVLSSNTIGTSYLWSSGETTKAITINKSGTYTAKVSDQNGCLSYASNALVINVLPIPAIPVITPSGPTSFCQGGSVVLKSSNAKLYSWSTGETTQSLSINQSGAFYLRTTDANGCLSAQSATINVVVNPLPLKPSVLAESATTFCVGESVILTTPIQSQYFWTNGATTQKAKITTTGKYAVKITDANGCASPLSDSISIIVNPLPTTPTIVADGATTFCADKGLMLSSSIDKNYRWSNGNATQQITVNVAGSYFVQTINAYGCMSLPSNIITTTTKPVPAAPVISPDGSLFFCDGASVKLCATPTTQIKWATGEEIACLSVTKAGDYYATYTGDNGCVSLPSNIITVNPQVLPSTPAIKQIGAYILEAQGVITGEAYRWELNKQLLLQNSASFKVNTEGVYQVQTQITYKLGTATLTCYSKASDPYTFKYYEFDKGIVLYPNPNTSGIFYVETKENLTNAVVVVYSMIGQEIGRYNIALFDDRKMIDLHTLPVGNYLVRVTNSSFDYTRMVMIVR